MKPNMQIDANKMNQVEFFTENNDAGNTALHGLSCPQCGGMVPIPEGQPVVSCPYCELRSFVHGDRGIRRYQVPLQLAREQAVKSIQRFLTSSWAIAPNAKRQADLLEDFIVYLPFWVNWARVLGWVFGKKKVGSGKNRRYVPREVKIAENMTWTRAACDVGEFGVTRLNLADQPIEPFNADKLHDLGMVFEPIGSMSDAQEAASQDFQKRVQDLGNLDRVSQTFAWEVRKRFGLVFYPLWVLRYLYRGRSFQIVVDGYSGKVLFGKAPGNTYYRAAMMIGGAALGAFLAVDASALAFYGATQSIGDGAGALLIAGLIMIGAGIMVMNKAYNRFRFGEVYEFTGYNKRRRKIFSRKEGGITRAYEEEL